MLQNKLIKMVEIAAVKVMTALFVMFLLITSPSYANEDMIVVYARKNLDNNSFDVKPIFNLYYKETNPQYLLELCRMKAANPDMLFSKYRQSIADMFQFPQPGSEDVEITAKRLLAFRLKSFPHPLYLDILGVRSKLECILEIARGKEEARILENLDGVNSITDELKLKNYKSNDGGKTMVTLLSRSIIRDELKQNRTENYSKELGGISLKTKEEAKNDREEAYSRVLEYWRIGDDVKKWRNKVRERENELRKQVRGNMLNSYNHVLMLFVLADFAYDKGDEELSYSLFAAGLVRNYQKTVSIAQEIAMIFKRSDLYDKDVKPMTSIEADFMSISKRPYWKTLWPIDKRLINYTIIIDEDVMRRKIIDGRADILNQRY